MFERYTEQARRSIFFGRHEASQSGSSYIEAEHLLLALFREDKTLANRFFRSQPDVESLRKYLDDHAAPGSKVPASMDLPLSHQCKRVLAYGAEEAERLNHHHIGTEHLLLGILREEECFASQLLRKEGLSLNSAREKARRPEAPTVPKGAAALDRLEKYLDGCEILGAIYSVRQEPVANRMAHFGIYAAGPQTEDGQDLTAMEKLAVIQNRIDRLVSGMKRAVGEHDFEKARRLAAEERNERENLRSLREQFNLAELRPRVPVLCIEIIREESLSELQKRYHDYLTEGVAEIWVLDPELKRAYTVTEAEGLREFRGAVLRLASPPLELELGAIFES